ncbi:MAG: bifunctional (p)ppGpp synthetase/guanosine-3',5'-bis(diphosphate) 3'-pyrophosphohydrolase [Clostridia bacterium]|nr:bifunctional (p)ppGpp synthetase/guanosine-3',5'-bis(diphosphate) 3'-pyrophosphohydrolase [Clostridia bacterium]
MKYTPMINKALRLCFDAHINQVDKSGVPYVFHPIHLAEQMDDEISIICALLHDVVEDTKYTFEDIRNLGFSEDVIDILKLLTHDKDTPYLEYVKQITTNKIALKIKLADIKHNSDLTRLEEVNDQILDKIKVYKQALDILTNSN